ncbi:MAG: aminomethyl-transferring glycine dehydrogenase subunit GcvPA [Candidatus Bathyarchaeia archaeon]
MIARIERPSLLKIRRQVEGEWFNMSGRMVHHYIPNSSPETLKMMLDEMRLNSIDELYTDIPDRVRLRGRLNIPKAMSEYEVERHVEELLLRNKTVFDAPCFLGGGCWPHYVPAAVEMVVGRSEFATSYTPYQAEASQGILQALFEYQSMICELTEMDYSNSSMYDWATALGEAARMARRVTGRNEIITPYYMDPHRASTLKVYSEPAGMKVLTCTQDPVTGQIVVEKLQEMITSQTAAVYVENPSYLGFFEKQIDLISDLAHDKGGLLIVGVDPISLGVVKPPGEYGADIVVGEGQPLGNHMNYGGPSLGIFACSGDRLLRQMPGRIVGLTSTLEGGDEAYCLVHQTREQHIRRERATSNICTNEALCAVAAAVYLSLLGPEGLRRLCETIMVKSHYAMKIMNSIDGVKTPIFEAPHFKEFTVNFKDTGRRVDEIHRRLLDRGIQAGKVLKEYPELGEAALYCVTEVHTKEMIDSLADNIREILR